MSTGALAKAITEGVCDGGGGGGGGMDGTKEATSRACQQQHGVKQSPHVG